ncbi:NRDE family protein [Ferruginibacter profundus]
MCTVSFIPTKDKFYLTSNRDEKVLRKAAFPPAIYWGNGSGLVYPKDAEAGGSWISISQNGNAAVLLNGAFTKHISQPPYRLSRGIIFLDIIGAARPCFAFTKINLHHIEPFTMIIFENNSLFECRWDGQQKHCKQLKNNRPYIWSSSTLYEQDVVTKRESWFIQWLNKKPSPTLEDILQFHQFTGDGDSNNDLVMNRDGKMITVSVTGIELEKYSGKMQYIDLKNNSVTIQQFAFGHLQKVA